MYQQHEFSPKIQVSFWIVWVQKNKECMLFAVPASCLNQKALALQRLFGFSGI
jgi:hypothetical protein